MKTWGFFPIILILFISACSRLETETAAISPPPPERPQTTQTGMNNPPGSVPPNTVPPATSAPSSPVAEAKGEAQGSQNAVIYLVAIGDEGISGRKIGCGDSLVPIEIHFSPTQAVLRAALQALLEIRQPYYGNSGLYNALYQSELEIKNLKIQDGTAEIDLVGRLQLGGVCDSPRIEEQLNALALQFDTVHKAVITVNGTELSELLSLK